MGSKIFENSRFYNYFYMLVEEKKILESKKVNFLFFQTPIYQNIVGLSEFEKSRLENWTFDFNNITDKDCMLIKEIYSPDMDIDYLKQLYDGSKVYENNGVKCLADFRSEYVNVIDGKRITYYQPSKYRNKIYVFGQCTARGTGVEDRHTIESFLQDMINKEFPNTYKVINMAVGCGSDLYDDIMHMRQVEFKNGDIVILCTDLEIVPLNLFAENNIDYYDCSSLFNRPHSYGEWFTDSTFHTNNKGNKVIAEYIYDTLYERKLLYGEEKKLLDGKEAKIIDTDEIPIPNKEQLEPYLEALSIYKKENSRNGCIVMNCNPFTKGHQYLIEEAASRVDYLYIFVVEEDKSYFPYSVRMELVKKGTAHLNNVLVLPSGKFIASAITFPGYFLRDGNKEIIVDTTLDIRIFGRYIAKALNIQVRFAGEEPYDYVTHCYNETMREILPKYGVNFVEIKRKEQGGKVISAKLVRKYLEEKNFEEIKKLVPDVTYDYLVNKYDR